MSLVDFLEYKERGGTLTEKQYEAVRDADWLMCHFSDGWRTYEGKEEPSSADCVIYAQLCAIYPSDRTPQWKWKQVEILRGDLKRPPEGNFLMDASAQYKKTFGLA